MESPTTRKGEYAQAIYAPILRLGYQIAMPLGHDLPFDIIAIKENKLYRVQCKYSKSDGYRIKVRCRRTGQRSETRYTSENIDWLANYDETSGVCVYIPSSELGINGRNEYSIRLVKFGGRSRSRFVENFATPPVPAELKKS